MNNQLKITILGCGPSGGVPLVGNIWGNCDPHNIKNSRTRSSIFVQTELHNILIDTSPDLRQQLLRQQISHVDGVFFTHAHADHCHGIDDLRALYFGRNKDPIPAYGAVQTMEDLNQSFAYLFQGKNPQYPSVLNAAVLPVYQNIELFNLQWCLFEQDHGFSTSTGYRFNNVAYSTDVVHLNEQAFDHLHNLDVWIVDCLSEEKKPTHSHLEQTLQWIERVKPTRAILTHMDHSLDYEQLRGKLPPYVEPAYDGMVINI